MSSYFTWVCISAYKVPLTSLWTFIFLKNTVIVYIFSVIKCTYKDLNNLQIFHFTPLTPIF